MQMSKIRNLALAVMTAAAVVGCSNNPSQTTKPASKPVETIQPLKWDDNEPFARFQATDAEMHKQVSYILKNTAQTDAEKLYIAANSAFVLERLEDAGFLFYAAVLRTESDLERFPPKKQDQQSPIPYLNFLAANSAARIDQMLTFNPDHYEKVLQRFKAWDCSISNDYQPSWEYTAVNPSASACSVIQQKRIQPMQRFTQLFANPGYRKNVERLRGYLELSPEQQQQEQTAAEINQLLQAMLDFEREQDNPGIAAALLRNMPK